MKNNRIFLPQFIGSLCVFLSVFFTTFGVQAQSNTVKVNVQALPPYSNNVHDYIGGNSNELSIRYKEQVLIALQNNSPTQSQEVKLIASVTGDNGIFAEINRNYIPLRPITLAPGELKVMSGQELEEINRNITENNITYGGFDPKQIARTGTLPEGNYRICVVAYDYNSNQKLSMSQPIGCSPPIPIAFPDPPVIVYPFHQSEVLATKPPALNISWAPSPNLNSVVRYRVRIIELSNVNANPYDLMERSTISFFEEDNILTTNLFYDITKPAFKVGNTYAIRVQAYDPFNQLQIKNNGRSEIHIFEYLKTLSDGSTNADINYISLQPGFLKLINLQDLDVREEGNNYVFDGYAELEIISSQAQEPDVLRVEVNDLVVQKGNNAAPLIHSGGVKVNVNRLPTALRDLEGLVDVKSLTWNTKEGLNVSGTIRGPTGETFSATGNLSVRPDGIYGEIGVSSLGNQPLFKFGSEPVELAINRYGIAFPDACKSFEGTLSLFNSENEDEKIEIAAQSCGGEVKFDLAMLIENKLSLDNGNGALHLTTKSLSGEVIPSWEDQTLFYDLDLMSKIGFTNIDSAICGLNLLMNLHVEKGISMQNAGNSCSSAQSTLPLGPAYLSYNKFKLDELTYVAGNWNFNISLDGQFTFPVFGGFTTNTYKNIRITESGIDIPSMSYKKGDIYLTSLADWGDYLIELEEFVQSPVTLPFFKPEKIGPGDWDFSIRARVEFKDDENMPRCLSGGSIYITAVNFDDRVMGGVIEPQDIGDCTWEFGAGYALNFNSIEGAVSVEFEGVNHRSLGGDLTLDFDFLFGEPFACEGAKQITVADSELKLAGGMINGVVDQLVPPCQLKIGPLRAIVNESTLRFEGSKNLGQNIFMDGKATLDYKGLSTEGTFTLDLKTGKFIDVLFEITEPFVLDLPEEDKVISFKINKAVISEDGFLIDGRNELVLSNQTIGATFDNLLLDLSDNHIKSGTVIIDSPFAFEAAIDQQNKLTFEAVAIDHQLVKSPALKMQLAGTIKIDSTGLASSGLASGAINFEGIAYDSIYAEYHEDFKLGFYPFQIRNGQVDFYYKQQRIAYVDASGFHPDWTSFGDAFIPDRIPMPTEEIAYIQIKENDELLVNVQEDGMGNTIVSTKPGQPVQLFVPAFQGNSGQIPQIAVDFNNLVLDGSNGSVIGGSVVATVPDKDPAFDLTNRGIPITPKQLAFGVNSQGDVDVTGLFVKGNLTLFDKDLGQPASVVLGIQSDGHLRGVFDLQGIDVSVPMMGLNDYVQLNFKNLDGSFDIPLQDSPDDPYYLINFDSDFKIVNSAGSLVVSAELSAKYQTGNLTIKDFNATVNQDEAAINIHPFEIKIQELSSLNLTYSPQDGFNFSTSIDCSFGFQLSNGTKFEFPLKNVELGSLDGFTIPAQDIHDGSWPELDPPSVDFGVFHLQPIAFRLPAINFNWFNWSFGQALAFAPKIDLELSFPSLQYDAPEFSQPTLTLSDIGFEKGILIGSMEPFTFPGDGAFLPIGGDLGINVKEISGALNFALDSLQGFAIDLKGKLKYPDLFKKNEVCTQTEVSLSMDRNAHFTGLVEDFTPCGELRQGPLTLKFNSTQLKFEIDADEQQASLSGSATTLIERANANTVNATGNIGLNLIKGKLTNGSILLTGPFEWQYSQQDSLFVFTVQTARLDTAGLAFTGNGSLKLGNGNNNLTYNDLTFSLSNGKLKDGSVRIHNAFALDVGLNPTSWSIENPAEPTTNDPGIRLTMPADLLLDKTGLAVNDSSIASLSYGEEQYDLLQVHYDNFKLGVDPVQVTSGQADFFLDSPTGNEPIRIAYFDKTGFHLDDGTSIITALLPDTLALPTKEIAYIVLRDQNGDLMVDIKSVSNGKKINSQQVLPMVIAAFDKTNPITTNVQITDLIINDAFEVVQGTIDTDLSASPIDISPLADIPLELTRIIYEKPASGSYALFTSATLKLPEALNAVEVELQKIEFAAGGFKNGQITAGTYQTTFNPNIIAIAQQSFENDAFRFAVTGVEFDFAQSGNAYKISGNLGSNIFKDENNSESVIHYAGEYDTSLGWDFALDAQHLPQMEIAVDKAKMILDNLEISFDNNDFGLIIDSRLTFDEVMGDDFQVTINDLQLGTSGISVSSVNTDAIQYLSLFNQTDNLELTDLGVSFSNSVLFVSLDGSLNFMERDLDFTALKIGTDGSVLLDGLNANLLTADFEILGQYLVLKEIGLTTLNGKIAILAGGEVNLPEPFTQSENGLSISVNYLGQADVEMPSITATNVPEVDLGGFAVLDMTGVGIDFDPMELQNMAFFASADLNIPDSKNGGVNTIEFGKANGDINDAGIYYSYGDNDIHWNITNSPSFSFDQTFFKLAVSNISAGSTGGFKVTMDADATLQFEQVAGGGRMEGITIDKTGVDWGTFAGANFTFVDFVDVEVGSFEYFSDGGEITLEKGSGNGPKSSEVSEETIQVDEYLNFSNPTGNALSISIGDEDSFSASGGIESIIYYKKGDELYFNMKGATLELHDMARLYASVEYQQSDAGFLLRVAGGAEITPPAVNPIGVVAVGKLAKINGKFSMGIFVATKGIPIPIIPGIIEINKFGGGFFYNAESADLTLVTEATDYDPYKEKVPWEDTSREFDFAIIFYGGVGVIGTGGTYAFNGEMLMVIASDFLLIDARFDMKSAPLEGGAYFSMDFQPNKFVLEAGGGMTLKENPAVKGGLGVNFTAIKIPNQNLQWAFTGGTNVAGGEPIKILGILNANATVIVSNDGFLLDCSVSAGFDIWIVKVEGGLEATVWYLVDQQQFGAYARVYIDASVLGGLFQLGGEAVGALIVEPGKYIIYASLTGYVKVALVFNGDMTVWFSIQKSGFKAGTGQSGYEDLINEARENARKLNEKAEDLLASIEDAKNAIVPLSNETLARSGQALFMASQSVRNNWGDQFIQNEQKFETPVDQAFLNMRDQVVTGDRPGKGQVSNMLSQMKSSTEILNQKIDEVIPRLQELRNSALEWESEAQDLVANLQNPVQFTTQWQGEIAPSFNVDTVQSTKNRNESSNLKQNISELSSKVFEASIDTTLSNIHKIESAMDGRVYSLVPSGAVNDDNIAKMAHFFTETNYKARRYYSNQISYFWALRKWADFKSLVYSQYVEEYWNDGPLDLATKDMINAWGIEYTDYSEIYEGDQYKYANITMNGVDFYSGASDTWNLLSAQEKSQALNGFTKNPDLVAQAVGQRRNLILAMDPVIGNQEAQNQKQTTENNMKANWQNREFYNFISGVKNSSNEIYKMHSLGLDAIEEISKNKADSLVQAAHNVLAELDDKHQDFTSLQNEIYQLKHSTLISLYAMYELHAEYIKQKDGEDAAYNINNKLRELEDILTAPRINSMSLITHQGENKFDRELQIGWEAFHPYKPSSVNVVENSYSIKEGHDNNVYTDSFKSTGENDLMLFHMFSDDADGVAKDISIKVRVRGAGGNTVTRYANTTVKFDASDITTSEGNILQKDGTPPNAPDVLLNYKKNQPSGFNKKKYWSNDQSSIEFNIIALDRESDIATIEYAIGTTQGGTDITDWQVGQARNNLSGNHSYGNTLKTVVARNLNLITEQDYYVSARVTNGEGLTSTATEHNTALRLDLGAPNNLKEEYMYTINPINIPVYLPISYNPNYVTETPQLQPPPTPDNGNNPTTEIRWHTGLDSLSGIHQYEYVISNQSEFDKALEFSQVEHISNIRPKLSFSGAPLNYSDTSYIYVWAKDYAGNRSVPLTFARLPIDKTPPKPPQTTIMNQPDGLKLFITRPSYDPESRVKGFQYAVGTTPYGIDVKNWPEGSELDQLNMSNGGLFSTELVLHSWREYATGNLSDWYDTGDVPTYEIRPTGLQQGIPLYVTYRTVNGQGAKSSTSASGPVTLDTSAPPKPGVTLLFSTNGMKIQVSNIKDDETGIKKVEYVARDKFVYSFNYNWQQFTSISGIRKTPINHTRTLFNWGVSLERTTVGLRITNGNGMQSTYWFDGSQYGQYYVGDINNNFPPIGDYNINWD